MQVGGVWKGAGAEVGVWRGAGAEVGVWRGAGVEVGVWRGAGVEVRVWRDVGGSAVMKAVLQHGFMCTVETMKERVLLSDVEEHVGVDVPSILVGNI